MQNLQVASRYPYKAIHNLIENCGLSLLDYFLPPRRRPRQSEKSAALCTL